MLIAEVLPPFGILLSSFPSVSAFIFSWSKYMTMSGALFFSGRVQICPVRHAVTAARFTTTALNAVTGKRPA
jgi:hypothetical protein